MQDGGTDRAGRVARQGVRHGAGEDLGTERQQEEKDAVAEVIQTPAGLAEEPMKRAEVFEAAQAAGLNDAGEGAAAGAEDPGAGERREGGETGLGKARLKGEEERRKGSDQEEIGHRRGALFHTLNERHSTQKKAPLSAFCVPPANPPSAPRPASAIPSSPHTTSPPPRP